jgi:hypothetical protein
MLRQISCRDFQTALKNQNVIQEEIERRLITGSACYHWVQTLLFSSQLFKYINNNIYRIIILPLVFYGCETWSLTIGEEHRLRVFENRVLRKTFEPKRNEVTGEWRKLHNEEFHEQCNSRSILGVNKSRRMRWAGYVAHEGERSGPYRVLVVGKKPLESLRHRWEGY